MLAAIAQGVPADSFAYLLATAPGTTAKERPTPWAAGWKVYDLENGVQGSPQRLFVALGPDKKALLLSAEPDNVVQLSKTTRVQDAPGAVQRAKDYLELSRSMARLSYAVDSVDQIDWLPKPTADDTARKQKLVQDYATRIKPAAAKPAGDGWTVEVWTVDDRSLALHTLSVGRDGTITDSAQTLEKDIPVPYSV